MAKRAMTEAAKAEKREMILDKAAELLVNKDFEEIKMAELAKSLNISNGLLFVYFKTKETLFLNLLWREYQKRLFRMKQKLSEKLPENLEELKSFFLENLTEIIDNHVLYILLETKRAAILEKNVDGEELARMKLKMYQGANEIAETLAQTGLITEADFFQIIFTESALLVSLKFEADLSEKIKEQLETMGLINFQHNFKEELLTSFRYYLTGFLATK